MMKELRYLIFPYLFSKLNKTFKQCWYKPQCFGTGTRDIGLQCIYQKEFTKYWTANAGSDSNLPEEQKVVELISHQENLYAQEDCGERKSECVIDLKFTL